MSVLNIRALHHGSTSSTRHSTFICNLGLFAVEEDGSLFSFFKCNERLPFPKTIIFSLVYIPVPTWSSNKNTNLSVRAQLKASSKKRIESPSLPWTKQNYSSELIRPQISTKSDHPSTAPLLLGRSSADENHCTSEKSSGLPEPLSPSHALQASD